MGTRDELVTSVGVRYRGASREEKGRILEDFVAVSGYCRKHAAGLLHRDGRPSRSEPRLSRRTYDDAVREALVVLWESSDRICGKRLKALIPMLVGSMEQHGHLSLDEEVRAQLMKISAATIDRVLAPMRALMPMLEQAGKGDDLGTALVRYPSQPAGMADSRHYQISSRFSSVALVSRIHPPICPESLAGSTVCEILLWPRDQTTGRAGPHVRCRDPRRAGPPVQRFANRDGGGR